MSRARPYIPAGCDQQGRLMPAEACTELGADTAAPRLGLLTRARIALLQWHIACITDEREHYRALSWVGPGYLRESYSRQRQLMTRIAELQAVPARRPAGLRRTLATALAALTGAAGLVLAACGGGGTDEEPTPRPQPDCSARPEVCK